MTDVAAGATKARTAKHPTSRSGLPTQETAKSDLPKPGTPKVACGSPYCGRLKILKNSERSSRFVREKMQSGR